MSELAFSYSEDSDLPLSTWLPAFARSQELAGLIARFERDDGHITYPDETAMLYALIRRLRPRLSLEIGTFFAHTTRIMAEAIVDAGIDGKLVTLDPFGGHRVPGILETWPQSLRDVTDFRPHNSMQYFLELETLGTPKGADSPFAVVFVDGHHDFEYALYDIIRSADHLAPGGAIMVDNLELEGPKMALVQFLHWNPAWCLFYKGNILSAGNVDPSMFVSESGREHWAILIAPAGIQVGRQPIKLMKRGIAYVPMRALEFNVRFISQPGTLHANMLYYSVPYDFHITGEGMLRCRGKVQAVANGTDSVLTATFSPQLVLEPRRPDINICYDLELSYLSSLGTDAFILLDPHNSFNIAP